MVGTSIGVKAGAAYDSRTAIYLLSATERGGYLREIHEQLEMTIINERYPQSKGFATNGI